MPLDRRFRRMKISPHVLLELMKPKPYKEWLEITRGALPQDAQFVASHWDEWTGRIDALIWSSEWAPIPEGYEVPILDPPEIISHIVTNITEGMEA